MLFLLMKLHWPTLFSSHFAKKNTLTCVVSRMATFSIGTHFSTFQHSRNSKLPLHGPCIAESSPFLGSSTCRTRFIGTTPKLLRHNVLARAEDKARDPASSSFQPQQSSQQQFQVLLLYDPLTKFYEYPFNHSGLLVYKFWCLMLGMHNKG